MTAPNTPAETSDQLNKPAKSGKLEVSDLITIGVFAALYFVMVCIATLVSTLFTGGFGSIFLPAITALISGCVYMLLAARLGKFGGITVMGVIIGLFLFISGHFVLSFIASIVFPVAADLIARAGKYKSKALLLVSYVVFAYGLTGPILPLWFWSTLSPITIIISRRLMYHRRTLILPRILRSMSGRHECGGNFQTFYHD